MKTDDPKLTAYALGELAPEERAEIEALLRDDPEIAADIEATRVFAAQLRRELESENGTPLTEAQRARVLRTAVPIAHDDLPTKANAPRWGSWILRIAACLALLTIVAGLLFPAVSSVKENARKTKQMVDVQAAIMESQRTKRLAANEPEPEFSSRYQLPSDPGTEDEAAGNRPAQLAPAKKEEPVLLEPGAQPDNPKRTLLAQLHDAGQTESPRMRGSSPRPVDGWITDPAKNTPQPARAATMPSALDQKSATADPVLRAKASNVTNLSTQPSPVSGGLQLAESQTAQRVEGEQKRIADKLGVIVASSAVNHPIASEGLLPSESVPSLNQKERHYFEYQEPEEVVRLQRQLQRLQKQPTDGNTEAYDAIVDNPFLDVRGNELSTFSIDVDTASYANVRRFLNGGQRPPKGAVRIEELINYFTYDYPQPDAGQPFSATIEIATCPWQTEHRLARIGLKGREIKRDQRPASNLVFLIDVSGSMQPANKLPLVKESLRLLVDQLGAEDSVAIAVYAGASGCVLEPTHDKNAIRAALDKLEAGGSTNGASGIQLAYDLAQKAFLRGGVNRVLLATDGDFNVGITSQSALLDLIEQKAKSGIFLTVLGFGMGNLKDSTLEKLADKGNGNYAYVDTLNEGRRVLVEQMSGTLVTIAKDVKIQVEFNPAQASSYRLVGYENRLLRKEDFNDDTKDAGEIGAGHSVTALYEIVPAGQPPGTRALDPLKYQQSELPVAKRGESAISRELFTLKLRYKAPDGEKSQLMEVPITDQGVTWEKSSRDFRFAAAVASFGMLLRDSPHKGNANWDTALELALEGKGEDASGYRAEFISLIGKAKALPQ